MYKEPDIIAFAMSVIFMSLFILFDTPWPILYGCIAFYCTGLICMAINYNRNR